MTPDGSVIVGRGRSGLGFEAFRWTATQGLVGIGDLPGGAFESEARAVSADASVIAGVSSSAFGQEAFLWTAENGMVPLGDLPGGSLSSQANAIAYDGSIIVGFGNNMLGDQEAFIWDATNGMRSLKSVLENDYGLDLSGWRLRDATGISADGQTIVGWGDRQPGASEAWIVHIPEPSGFAVFGSLFLVGWNTKPLRSCGKKIL